MKRLFVFESQPGYTSADPPFLLFSEWNQLQLILKHLPDKANLLPFPGDLYNPFSPDIVIDSLPLAKGVQTI
ncbi:MAG: hypothetical protein JRD88_03560 [Deltaproteobacteria bacterium]|jgi:hypothetical protein|nr:hypothetical protein [Deltaproteobacteria bacterium]